MIRFFVYMLTFPNGKSYIGVTSRLKRRLWEHEHRPRNLTGRAFQKFGSYELRVLAICDESYAYDLERRAIDTLGTIYPAGYNLMDGGMGGRRMGDATRRRMSQSAAARTLSTAHKQRISESRKGDMNWRPFQGRKHSEDTKAKIAQSNARRELSPETIAKMAASRSAWWERRRSAIQQ